jgi:hypothetical protein
MSRTIKGKKSPGHEYWTNRPLNYSGGNPGKETKKLTNRIERRTFKQKKIEEE